MTDASLQKIAATYGTPTFVFDTDALQARVRAIQTIWGREIDLCYSIKANPFATDCWFIFQGFSILPSSLVVEFSLNSWSSM